MRHVLTLALLVGALSGCGRSSSGNLLVAEGFRIENGQLVVCAREVPLGLFLGQVVLFNDELPGEPPNDSLYMRVPTAGMYDFDFLDGPTIMSGVSPDGQGTSDYLELSADGSEAFQIRLGAQISFQLQGSINVFTDRVDLEFFDEVPSVPGETTTPLGVHGMDIRIEEKPIAGLDLLDSMLGQIDGSLPSMRLPFTWSDPTGLEICHSNGVLVEVPDAESEITHIGVFASFLDQTAIDNLNSAFPEGSGSFGSTALATMPLAAAPGNYAFAFQVRAAPVDLTDPQKQLQIGYVVDRNDDEFDNFFGSPSFPKDLYDNSDYWLNGLWNFSTGLSLEVIDPRGGTFDEVASDARLIQNGEVSLFVVDADEISMLSVVQGGGPPPLPPYRLTFFKHFGDFGLNPPHDFKVDTSPVVGLPLARILFN